MAMINRLGCNKPMRGILSTTFDDMPVIIRAVQTNPTKNSNPYLSTHKYDETIEADISMELSADEVIMYNLLKAAEEDSKLGKYPRYEFTLTYDDYIMTGGIIEQVQSSGPRIIFSVIFKDYQNNNSCESCTA